jgi:hypothetical protein
LVQQGRAQDLKAVVDEVHRSGDVLDRGRVDRLASS